MALQKEVTLPSGEVGDYWVASSMRFQRKGMQVDVTLALYKDAAHAAAGADPLPKNYQFSFPVTQQQIVGNIVALAYVKIKAMIDQLHTPINGVGEPASHYPDLVGYVDA